MKKRILQIVFLAFISFQIPHQAQAFYDPFKVDFGLIAEYVSEEFNNISTKVQGALEEAQAVLTKFLYGDGQESGGLMALLKKPIDFAKKTIASVQSKLTELYKKRADVTESTDIEIDTAEKQSEQKIAALDANIAKAETKIAETAEVATKAKLAQQVNEWQKSKASIRMETQGKIDGLNENRRSELFNIKSQIDKFMADLKSSVQEIFTSPKVDKNYDSTEELKNTADIYSVAADTKITPSTVFSKSKMFKAIFMKTSGSVLSRKISLRSALNQDDENAGETTILSGQAQGLNDAADIAGIEAKKAAMQALVNYTEMVLQQLKQEISHDLADVGFKNFDRTIAIQEFDFSNYNFVPREEEIKEEKTDIPTAGSTPALDKSFSKASEEAVAAGLSSISSKGE